MLVLVSGNITDRKEYINTLIKEHGGDPSVVHRITKEDLSDEVTINELVITQTGLFGDKEFFVLNELARDLPLRSLGEEYANSPNLIIFSEKTITKKISGDIEKYGGAIQEYTPEAKSIGTSFNMFSLADALGNRDKKNLWLGYHLGLKHGSVEEINGILLWQLKNMMLVYVGDTSSMKSFVLSKNKRFVKNYSQQEVKDLIYRLTSAFHNRDIYDSLEIQVEKIILSL